MSLESAMHHELLLLAMYTNSTCFLYLLMEKVNALALLFSLCNNSIIIYETLGVLGIGETLAWS